MAGGAGRVFPGPGTQGPVAIPTILRASRPLQACTYSHLIGVQLLPGPTQGPVWRDICWGQRMQDTGPSRSPRLSPARPCSLLRKKGQDPSSHPKAEGQQTQQDGQLPLGTAGAPSPAGEVRPGREPRAVAGSASRPHAGLAQPSDAGCDQGQLGCSASELQNPPNVVVKEEQTGKGKGAPAMEGSRTHAWTGVGSSQGATPPSPPPMLGLWSLEIPLPSWYRRETRPGGSPWLLSGQGAAFCRRH